jgi:hypothetical protein
MHMDRVFSRRSFIFSVLAVVSLAAAVGAVSDGWNLTFLKSDADWPWVYVNDINDSGRMAGFWQDDSAPFPTTAIFWASGSSEAEELDGLDGFDDRSWASSLNNRGQIGGSAGSFPRHAVIWDKDGTPTDVHPSTPASFYSEIWGMNDHGDACGILGVQGWLRAYRWWSNGSSELLPKSDASVLANRAYGMNKAGAVAGTEFPAQGGLNAVYWDKAGNLNVLHDELVAAEGAIASSLAWKVTDEDEVTGVAWNNSPPIATRSWVWVWTEDDGVRFLDLDGTDHGVAWQSRGKYFAGSVNGNGNVPDNSEPAIWVRGNDRGETTYTLEVLPVPNGYEWATTSSVNTSGTACGVATDADGRIVSWVATRHASGNKYD